MDDEVIVPQERARDKSAGANRSIIFQCQERVTHRDHLVGAPSSRLLRRSCKATVQRGRLSRRANLCHDQAGRRSR